MILYRAHVAKQKFKMLLNYVSVKISVEISLLVQSKNYTRFSSSLTRVQSLKLSLDLTLNFGLVN